MPTLFAALSIRLLCLLSLGSMVCLPAQASIQESIQQYLNNQAPQQLALLKTLVAINSGTRNKAGVERVGNQLIPLLHELGFQTRWQALPDGMQHAGSLIAEHPVPGQPTLLLIGHLDTVFPADSPFQRFTLSADGKHASGPGVIDDKGGIVVMLYALKALQQANLLARANIAIILTGDEEQAARPITVSRAALRQLATADTIALGFEFALSDRQLVIGRRGLAEWWLSSTGKAQHSSTIFQADVGFGAIYEQARVLSQFASQLAKTPDLTINPGLQLGGQQLEENSLLEKGQVYGKKTIIASQALTHGDLRFASQQQLEQTSQRMQEIARQSLPGSHSEIRLQSIMPVMTPSAANQRLLENFSRINQQLGGPALSAVPIAERGGADISYIANQVSAAIDGLGPWGSGAHSPQETLTVDSLSQASARVALFIARMIEDGAQP